MIEKLRKQIMEANELYRLGKPIMSDSQYDKLLEELSSMSPDDKLLTKVGIEVIDESRKVKLPIPMFSMNKVKSYGELIHWLKLKNIPKNAKLIITPKLDGLSFASDGFSGFTRGDGIVGQKSDEHYKLIGNKFKDDIKGKFTFGEIMMNKKIFEEKYSSSFANSRNLVAGQLNNKIPQEILKDLVFIRYGINDDSFKSKSEQLKYLNSNQEIQIPFVISTIDKLSDEYLKSLFYSWNKDFELDGIVIEVDDVVLRNKLGREKSSNNPCFARAYKGNFEEIKETEIVDIKWHISKNGLLKPVAKVIPVNLDGAEVTFCTLNNALFVKENEIGIGSVVKIKRSGGVIPLIVSVLKKIKFEFPQIDGVEISWNKSGVELVSMTETDDQKLKQIISFFEIIECDNIGEGIVKQLWNSGYKTIKDILLMNHSDFEKLEGFGTRKSKIVYNSIHNKIKNIELNKLQHASNVFGGSLGSKKLKLLEHFEHKPTIEEVISIEGFAEKSAKIYIENFYKFQEFIKDLPITIKKEKKNNIKNMETNKDLSGEQFCFTGVRSKIMEKEITNRNGIVTGSVSGKTTYLVVKDLSSTSSKSEKARSLDIKIITLDNLSEMLGVDYEEEKKPKIDQ